ncbi:MAG: Mov34/MPN/PAD-1 family protein [Firmicutes bacterium]|nr:Mov34/MPN/PAD-1 family protein [Bacillota bacterium]
MKGRLLSRVVLIINPTALAKIWHHVYVEPGLECGGYLIGTMEKHDDVVVVGQIDDIFFIEGSGTQANFTFTSESGLQAYSYCTKNYSTDGVYKKNIIGNYHSHGKYATFFSEMDVKMMKASTSREFYLVFSPEHHSFSAIYKDSDSKIYEVDCRFEAPGFSYIAPKLNFEREWPLVRTGVDYTAASIVKPLEKNSVLPSNSSGKIIVEIAQVTRPTANMQTLMRNFSVEVGNFLTKIQNLRARVVKGTQECNSRELHDLRMNWLYVEKIKDRFAEENMRIRETMTRLGEEYLFGMDAEVYQRYRQCVAMCQEIATILEK